MVCSSAVAVALAIKLPDGLDQAVHGGKQSGKKILLPLIETLQQAFEPVTQLAAIFAAAVLLPALFQHAAELVDEGNQPEQDVSGITARFCRFFHEFRFA